MVGGVDATELEPENLEFTRMFAGMHCSQPEVARLLGITSGAVSRYLAGKIRPKRSVLRLLADLTGERLNLPGEEASQQARTQGPRWMADWEAEIVRILRTVDPEQRQRAIAAIRDLLQALGPKSRKKPKPPDRPDPLPTFEKSLEIFAGDIISGPSAKRAASGGEPTGEDSAHPGAAAQSAAGAAKSPRRPSRHEPQRDRGRA